VEDLTGGAIEARAAVELVEGSLIGVKVGHLGRRSTAIEPKPQRKLEEDQATCPNPECGRGIEPEWARCPFCGANLGN
jgi:hypothetical protein